MLLPRKSFLRAFGLSVWLCACFSTGICLSYKICVFQTNSCRMLDYGITKATPSMLLKMTYGTYLFFSIWTYIGVIFIYFCLPELKGRSLESMDDLFERSLWSMWKHAYPTEEEKIRHDVVENVMHQHEEIKNGAGITSMHIESA